MEKTQNNTTPQETLFNAGLSKLERIHKEWEIVAYARRMNNDYLRACALKNIRMNIHPKLNTKERETADGFEKALMQSNPNISGFQLKNTPEHLRYVYRGLDDYGLWLADMEEKYGMSLPNKPKDSDGMRME